MKELTEIFDRQREFQKAVGFPIDSVRESDRNDMSEKYIFKAIEELIELRKEFPSSMNPWSKTEKTSDINRIHEELSDVLLFIFNFMIVWKIPFEDMTGYISAVQENNFLRMKQKKMMRLNGEILSVPGYISGVGQGNLNAKYVFIGINPGQTITHGYQFWKSENDGSSRVLIPTLRNLGILDQCYFTNVVKSTTKDNSTPDKQTISFWKEYLIKELNIITVNNPGVKIIAMGHDAQEALGEDINAIGIRHPASVLYGNLTRDQYEESIKEIIKRS